MNREDFSLAVEAFLGELSLLCVSETEDTLRRLPEFFEHFREVAAVLHDPRTSNDEVLGAACGLIDEYVGANWESVLDSSYQFYCDQHVRDSGDAEHDVA